MKSTESDKKDAIRYRARREKAFKGAIAAAVDLLTTSVVDEPAARERWNKRYDLASDMLIGMQDSDRWIDYMASQWTPE